MSATVTVEEERQSDFAVTVRYLFAGGVAGAVSRTAVSPFERVKILFQVCCISHETRAHAWCVLLGARGDTA